MTAFLRLLLDSSIRIGIVALAVWMALLASRIRSSSLRHKAWVAVLCAMLSMPILPRVAPRLNLPISFGANMGTANMPLPDSGPFAADVPADAAPASMPAGPRELSPERIGTRPAVWPEIVLGVYAVGVAAFLCRLWAGWLIARRVLGASRRIFVQGTPAYESALVSTPVTMGLRVHKVVLPTDWSEWPEQKLRAVLAHESAHVRRRDTITSFLAHLNRCIFWFHPLAWWLQRQLALMAEQACDDEGVRAIGEKRKYAEVLLDMAEAVRRRRNRLVHLGVGVDGTGLLGLRIDRILRGAPVSRVSGAQKALVALSCAAAILAAAACHEKSIYSVALKPDPQNSAMLAKQKAGMDSFKAASGMNARQAEDLEAAVRQNPEDIEARRRLMIFYQTSGRKVMGDEKTAAAFWTHRLWCIEHHPDDVCASLIEPLSDPAATQQAKKLWLAAVQRKDASPDALISAAAFFQRTDPQLAEKIALSANVTDGRRTALLGRIYASVLTGDQGPYARDVRKKLEESNDAALLAATGFILGVFHRQSGNSSDAAVLGQSYLERALKLDPNSAEARDGLERIREANYYNQIHKRMVETVGQEPSETQYQKAAALPEADRFQLLPYLAERAYMVGDSVDYYHHNRAAARKDWELARRYAQDALGLAQGFVSDANYGDQVYKANMTLGMVAMRVDGDAKAARKYLLAASKAQTKDNSAFPIRLKLPVLLLKYGGPDGRRAVIDYLERYGKTFHRQDLDLLLAAKQLRRGIMPLWYEYQSAQLK